MRKVEHVWGKRLFGYSSTLEYACVNLSYKYRIIFKNAVYLCQYYEKRSKEFMEKN